MISYKRLMTQILRSSIQILPKCDSSLSGAAPWMGHSSRKGRRQNKDHIQLVNEDPRIPITRRGQIVHPPAQYNQVASPMAQPKGGQKLRSLHSRVSTRGGQSRRDS